MSKQGNQNRDISRLLNKVFGRHFEVFNKLAVTDKDSIYFLNCKYELKYKIIVTLQLSCKFLFCLIVCSYGWAGICVFITSEIASPAPTSHIVLFHIEFFINYGFHYCYFKESLYYFTL